jgi:thiol-disulfide isomerase/thioredoxin
MILFEPQAHAYSSIEADQIEWISATTLIGGLKEPFDGKAISLKSSKNKRSKWYGMDPEQILAVWKGEADRACSLGNFYHDQRESDILALETMQRHGKVLPIFAPVYDELGRKVAPDQRLQDGIYPELMVYLKSAGVCGQSDLVEVVDGRVHITDYKTNKKIETASYVSWDGVSKKMLPPVDNLDDCNFNHYNLQLSLYMYIILRHNPKLRFGSLTIHHIQFETAGEDAYGYPISKLDDNGDPILKGIEVFPMPYLREEIQRIVASLPALRPNLKKK